MKEMKVYIHASFVFFFFKTENNSFLKEIKHVLRAFHCLVKTFEKFLRILEEVICFHIIPNVRLGFHWAMKAR